MLKDDIVILNKIVKLYSIVKKTETRCKLLFPHYMLPSYLAFLKNQLLIAAKPVFCESIN